LQLEMLKASLHLLHKEHLFNYNKKSKIYVKMKKTYLKHAPKIFLILKVK